MLSLLSNTFSHITAFCVGVFMAVSSFFFPLPPTCLLVATTPAAEQSITTEGTAEITSGESVQITWSSTGADTVTMNGTARGAVSGTETFSPDVTTTYTYQFEHRNKQIQCSVTVTVKKKTVAVVTTPPAVIVPKTPVKVPPPVVTPPVVVPPVVTPPVTPPNKPPVVPEGPTTIAVANIPLLGGGQVHGSQTVPISYLQITNVGKASTVITGFWVTQTGTAPASAVIGLSTVDDHGGSRGSVGGGEGASPFTTYTALAPSDAHFEPGQLRLFTIKAKITGDTGSLVGSTISLVVSKVETAATAQGSFPIKGTTYTISK